MKTTITKEKISNQLKNKFGLSSLLCEEIVTCLFSEILNLAKEDGKITLQNFGTWRINHKKSRFGFNMKARHAVTIEERTTLNFAPAKSFKQQINSKNVK